RSRARPPGSWRACPRQPSGPRRTCYQPAIPGWFWAPSTTTFVPLIHDARAVRDLLGRPEPAVRELVADPPPERLRVARAPLVPAAAREQDRPRTQCV